MTSGCPVSLRLPAFLASILALLLALPLTGLAAERGTANEAKAMVQKAINAMKKGGVDATVSEINKRDGQYTDRDLYVVVYDLNGKNLAHLNPKMVGKLWIGTKDQDGHYLIQEMVGLANGPGDGWVDYKWPNPISKAIEQKSTYIEKLDNGTIIGCGIYK